jgi:DNA-binding transcriptional MerR regulator
MRQQSLAHTRPGGGVPADIGSARSGRYRVQDLARLAGTSVRNIRAYRERGLLAAPELTGRTGWYDDAHLARLRLITRLLERGYTLAAIRDLLAAWERDRPLPEVLGVEQLLTRPLAPDEPWVASVSEIAAAAGVAVEDLPLPRLQELGLVEVDGDQVVVLLPSLLDSIGRLSGIGLPLPVVLDLAATMATSFVDLAQHLVASVTAALYPTTDVVPLAQLEQQVATLVEAARTTARQLFGWSLERELAAALGRGIERRMVVPLRQVPEAVS